MPYDDRGNLASETDALGRVTAYAYDAMHRVTGITDANLGVTGMSYDANGQPCRGWFRRRARGKNTPTTRWTALPPGWTLRAQ